MRAFVTRGEGLAGLRLTERPLPVPGSKQILVRMTAVALNFRDLLVINGVAGWKPMEERIPVSDGVGVVVAVADDVSRVRIGDRVIGIFLPKWLEGELTAEAYVMPLGGATTDGVLAEYCLFHEESVVGAPAHLSDFEAATLPVAAVTAWHAVEVRGKVRPGQTVVIQGTGGVSLFALQFVLALGARPIVISRNGSKLERLRQLGVEDLIEYSDTSGWEDQVLSRTRGRGVDHVIEIIGGENLNRSLRAVRISGTICFIGLIAGLSAPINTYEFVTRNVHLHGIETGSRAMFEEMNHFIEEHELRPVIDQVYPFDDARSALSRLESGSHLGKLVVAIP